ncbi:MAG: hypothetical protein ACIAQ0_01755 [Phycisphaerales bacterium JB058]
MLDVTDRTIRRDREAVREANALAVDDTFASQIAGELLMEGRHAVARVRRVTREKQTPAATRIEGERVVVEILDRVTQRLQSLGFLPMAAKHIKADLTHTVDPFGTPEAIQSEIERLASLTGGPDSPSIDHLRGAAKLLTSVEPAEGNQS